MRIKSAVVRQYRVHRELKLDFHEARTLVGGPNECGKSTLAEAIHRAFFLKAKGNTDLHRAMVSNVFAGHPEVEVCFEAGGATYHLRKRFGSSGTTQLTSSKSSALSGDAAEIELARLLGVEAGLGGRAASSQWSHLWVWQGSNGSDPLDHANGQHTHLLRRLQDSGGAAAMQSDLDARVAKAFAAADEGNFLQNGKVKTGSELHRAEAEFRSAEEERLTAVARLDDTRRYARDFEEASQTLARVEKEIVKLTAQKQTVDAQLVRANELHQQTALQESARQSLDDRHESMQREHQKILELRARASTLEEELVPKHRETTRLMESQDIARRQADTVLLAYERAGESTRGARQRRDLAVAIQSRMEKSVRLEDLAKNMESCRTHQAALTGLRQELAKLPEFSDAQLVTLQKLEREQATAESRLEAMATGIEILAAEEPVFVAGEPLAIGASRVLSADAEVKVGHSLRFLIRPGGGTTLAEARQKAQDARLAFRKALDAHGLDSVAAAAQVTFQRRSLGTRIESAEEMLRHLNAAKLPAIFESAREALANAEAEVTRRAESCPEYPAPSSIHEAARAVQEAERSLREAEAGETQARELRAVASAALSRAEEAAQAHRQALKQQTDALDEVRTQIRLLVEMHGEDGPRAEALQEASAKLQTASEVLAATRRQWKELQPELLKSDAKRFSDALQRAGDETSAAREKRLLAQHNLQSEGTYDPEADLAMANARARTAHERLASVRRKAEATKLLSDLFQEEQQALADQFTRPLAEKISGYLECLFGPGARANVVLAENAFSGLQLVRPQQGGGAVPFDSLSGGAREQVAAAVRLAMAEVLSSDHHGCLPIIFDDAFAYSDPDRVQTLQRMLYLAASRGLQVIVLTCAPSDYAALGAVLVPLRSEAPLPIELSLRGLELSKAQPAEGEPTVTATSARERILVTAEQREQLIATLREQGGKAVNQALRTRLGWDDSMYDSVKDDLIESGVIAPGRGRGGSVSLS